MALATRAGTDLTGALKPELGAMVQDLRERLAADPDVEAALRAQHRAALAANRSAASWTDWCTDLLTQAAVGWVLSTVFVRFCEDNRLLGGHHGSRTHGVWITSNDRIRRRQALDAERAFYLANSDLSYREWLETAFATLRTIPATAELVGDHSAIHILSPSSDAVNRLLTFWRRTDDNDDLVWDFADDELSTRFLGDLYQDLSEYAKDKYALLQTPEFVEEFILDQTMEPALKDRPLQGFRLIDPTCGSGHFLLGAFRRLLSRWDREEPGLEPWALVQKALDGVYGVDLNPFAVAIARFRLIVAALQAAHEKTLLDAPGFVVHVAVGDSLLHGESQLIMTPEGDPELDVDLAAADFAYSTEDLALLRSILVPGSYDVVVGNPPYIVARDKALNARYRELYSTCHRTYALTVPFMERFFQLAKPGPVAGWVGQITSNSFMKREFGAPPIEKFLANKDLRLIVDSSGAYIPGHGTPTVIIVGRSQGRTRETVRAVLGIRGEPGRPEIPAEGMVWTSIVDNVANVGHEDDWISIADLTRRSLQSHPWSLSGGGAGELLARVESASILPLESRVQEIGFGAVTREDAAYIVGTVALNHLEIDPAHRRQMVSGENVRDFHVQEAPEALWPYEQASLDADPDDRSIRLLWPNKTSLRQRVAYGANQIERGLQWFEYSMFFKKRYKDGPSIAFAFVATSNHFVLERGDRIFTRTAPIVKLHKEATEDDHLRLLGILNSSSACFWLKLSNHSVGRCGVSFV